MNKQEFLARLRKGLSLLPQEEQEERITFYDEMINDRTDDGLSEEEAVRSIGSVDTIIGQIVSEYSHEAQKKRLKVWEIVLLALGSPIWLSLLIATFAVAVSLYAAGWAVIASVWAVFAALLGSAVGIFVAALVFFFGGKALSGAAMLSTVAICAGLSIFLFFGCFELTKEAVRLTKMLILSIKRHFSRKEAAQ